MGSTRNLTFRIKRMDAITISFDEPAREEGAILAPPFLGQTEKVSRDFATTSRGAAPTGPRCAVADIDVVVHRNLFASPNVPPRDDVRRIAFEQFVSIGIATVIDMPVGDTQQHNLAIWVRTMVKAFAEILPNG